MLLPNGAPLSSGQQQLIGALRAYFSNTEVVLLDEVTSDMDGAIETEVIQLIKNMARTRIVLFVTHKIKSVTNSEHIYLFDRGSIIDEGTHTELLKRNDLYKELFYHDERQKDLL